MDKIMIEKPPIKLTVMAARGHIITLQIIVGTTKNTRGVKYFIFMVFLFLTKITAMNNPTSVSSFSTIHIMFVVLYHLIRIKNPLYIKLFRQ